MSLPRRGSATRRVGRHRSLHRISVASDAPVLILAVPGSAELADHDLLDQIVETAAESCPGVVITIGFLAGETDTLARAIESAPAQPGGQAPRAVVVPLLAGPHPVLDPEIAMTLSMASAPAMLGSHLGPHPLLAGALHDRLSEKGLARATRARGLNIAAGANGILVVADRGPQAIGDAGLTTVLLAARLAVPTAPAAMGDPDSIDAAVGRLREAGATHLAIAPCVIGPETRPGEFDALSAELGAPCAEPIGAHPAIAQLAAARYGEALARMSAASYRQSGSP